MAKAKFIFMLFVVGLLCTAKERPAKAADWFQLQGTEFRRASALKIWGFVQPTYFFDRSDRLVDFTNFRSNDFNIRRARVGIRGVVPGTDAKVNYFFLAEFGRNGITQDPNGIGGNAVGLTDASVTVNYIKGLRFRFGQFKVPIGTDGLQAIHVHNYIEFSDVFFNLMLERFGRDRSVGAYRDIGFQVFDWFRFDSFEFAYAVHVGNGNGINAQDNDDKKDVTAKITFAHIFNNSVGPRREEIQFGFWVQTGDRSGRKFVKPSGPGLAPSNGDIAKQDRDRYGIDFMYKKKPFRLSFETVWGNGWVFSPGFFGGKVPGNKRFFTDNQSIDGHGVPHADLDAFGYYIEGSYTPPFNFLKKYNHVLELDARFSFYDPDNGDDLATSVQQTTVTLGFQYFFHPRARFTFNYEFRDVDWDDNVKDRVMTQMTLIF